MISDIAYHDYVLLLCSLDAEWSRQRVDQHGGEMRPARQVFEHFTTSCWQYRLGIEANYEKFTRANGENVADQVSDYLFNPLCYIPFGHADAMVMVLLDDFDPLHHVTATARNAFEEVCIGFCPRLDEGLGVDRQRDPWFQDLHTLLGEQPRLPVRSTVHDGARRAYHQSESLFSPALHEFSAAAPLLVFSRYKMDALGALGQSLLFQQILLRAIVKKVRHVMSVLQRECRNSGIAAQLIAPEHLPETRVVLIDLQRSEEVGTLIFCNNLSIAASLLAGIKSLRYGDLFHPDIDRDGMLKQLMGRSRTHQAVITKSSELIGLAGSSTEDRLEGVDRLAENHVVRWTYSQMAVAWDTFVSTDDARCHGYVEAISEFQLAPGHRVEVERRLFDAMGARKTTYGLEINPRSYHHCLVGTSDLAVMHGFPRSIGEPGSDALVEERNLQLVALRDVINNRREVVRTFGCQNVGNIRGRDVIDFCTKLVLPIPKVVVDQDGRQFDAICGERGEAHFSPCSVLLRRVQERLFYPEDVSEAERKQLPDRTAGRLSLFKLAQVPRTYGVPVSLRRTIEYLYQDFATFIADPFLFDSVLDLYDSFATLHAVLTEHLPKVLEQELSWECHTRRRILDEERISQLSLLVDAMRNALEHRMIGAYPETHVRETAIDFRGGLIQILLAADAPMKCGLGLFRRFARLEGPRESRSRVGALTQIQFAPGARFCILKLGTEGQARLGFLAGDVSHVLHVATYGNYLHEAFHLIFDELCQNLGPKWPTSTAGFRGAQISGIMRERLGEVFAIFLTQVFLCGLDVRCFRSYALISYSQSVASFGTDDGDTVIRFVEFLIRLFTGTYLAEVFGGMNLLQMRRPPLGEIDDVKKALQHFEGMIDEFGALFSEYDRLWKGRNRQNVKQYCVTQFRDIYSVLRKMLPEIWERGIRIYYRHLAEVFPGGPLAESARDEDIALAIENLSEKQVAQFNALQAGIEEAVLQGMREGRAVIRGLCRKEFCCGEDQALDPLLLICAMLRHYISETRNFRRDAEGEFRDMHLRRDPETGDISFQHACGKWHEFLIDRGAPAMFCCVPSTRRGRLRKQIAILKTFWDISSALRARRLYQIIKDNWSGLELDADRSRGDSG